HYATVEWLVGIIPTPAVSLPYFDHYPAELRPPLAQSHQGNVRYLHTRFLMTLTYIHRLRNGWQSWLACPNRVVRSPICQHYLHRTSSCYYINKALSYTLHPLSPQLTEQFTLT